MKPVLTDGRLTGVTRYRLGFRGRIVLQVEEEMSATLFTDETALRWRDATVADFINLGEDKKGAMDLGLVIATVRAKA